MLLTGEKIFASEVLQSSQASSGSGTTFIQKVLSNANNCETKDRFEHGKSHGYGGALITWVLPCIHGKYDGMAKLIQYDFCHAV